MRVHVLQHVPFEGIGSMQSWLAEQNAEISYTRFFESSELPELHDLDLIIIMGGPMSVNDEATLPWLVKEKQFIRDAIQHQVPILGICLGSQLIASALGASVYPGKQKEIGWFDIHAAPSSTSPTESGSHFTFPPQHKVFHWHGETFDLPAGAVHLAQSAACKHQAFQIGSHVIGLQFHLETTPESARSLVEHCSDELVPAEFIQTKEDLLNAPSEHYAGIHSLMRDILTYLTRKS